MAAKGNELIEVILHGASGLPLTPDGKVPQPFAVVYVFIVIKYFESRLWFLCMYLLYFDK